MDGQRHNENTSNKVRLPRWISLIDLIGELRDRGFVGDWSVVCLEIRCFNRRERIGRILPGKLDRASETDRGLWNELRFYRISGLCDDINGIDRAFQSKELESVAQDFFAATVVETGVIGVRLEIDAAKVGPRIEDIEVANLPQ